MQILPLHEKKREVPEGQMATHQVTPLVSPERERGGPPDLKQADPTLRLERGVVEAQDLPPLWLLTQ